MRRIILIAAVAVHLGCATALYPPHRLDPPLPQWPAAGTWFTELANRLDIGDVAKVWLRDGTVQGEVTGMSNRDLTILAKGHPRQLPCDEVNAVAKVSPNAPIIGGIVAGLLALLPAYNSCGNLACWAGGMAAYISIGAGIGRHTAPGVLVYAASPGSCSVSR